MGLQGLIPARDFIKLARTTRDTLSYYDEIGLLPAFRDERNNYRYYSAQQLGTLNVINILKELGMPLAEIMKLKDERSPELMDALLVSQIEPVEQLIDKWVGAKKLLLLLQKVIHSALDADENVVEIKYMPSEAIILGEINDYGQGEDDYSALLTFYADMQKQYPDLDVNYPVWARYRGERIKNGDWRWPDRYYFYNPDGRDRKPRGFYAVSYARGGYGQTDELYTRMNSYIDKNGFEISGDAYEEYPINEFSASNPSEYLIRVMISVRERA